MKITLAKEIQAKFKAGLQICGEDKAGNLEWIGTTQQWGTIDETLDAYDMSQN